MSKLTLSLLSVTTLIAAVLAYVFIPTHTRLGGQVVDKPVGETLVFQGYKLISTEPKDGKLHHYFLLSPGGEISDAAPFLVTSDPFAQIKISGENKLQLNVNGRVKALDNDLWIENIDGTVTHWLVSANVKHVRAH